jgi:tetratricopeptide (TPR) repeat protein
MKSFKKTILLTTTALSITLISSLAASPCFSEGIDKQRNHKSSLANRSAESLDDLFARLKQEANSSSAAIIAKSIIGRFQQSENKTIELLMTWSDIAHRKNKQFGTALDLLDQITVLDPNYAEGWNKRATIYYEQGKYALSIKDIERTLALEPRHFGALSGFAIILETIGYPERAEQAWKAVLDIYPANLNAQSSYARLIEENAAILH